MNAVGSSRRPRRLPEGRQLQATLSASRSTAAARSAGLGGRRRGPPAPSAGRYPEWAPRLRPWPARRLGAERRTAAAVARSRLRARRPRRPAGPPCPSQPASRRAYSSRSDTVLDPRRRAGPPLAARRPGPRRCRGRAGRPSRGATNSNSGIRRRDQIAHRVVAALSAAARTGPARSARSRRTSAPRTSGRRRRPASAAFMPGRVAVEGEDHLAGEARRESISSRRSTLTCSSPNAVPQVATAVVDAGQVAGHHVGVALDDRRPACCRAMSRLARSTP